MKSYLRYLSERSPSYRDCFKQVWNETSRKINTLRETFRTCSIECSADYEESVMCSQLEISIESVMQDFEHYCIDNMYNRTYGHLLPPWVDDINPEDSFFSIGSSSCYRHVGH